MTVPYLSGVSSRAYTSRQTGTPSRYGSAQGGVSRNLLNPWGNIATTRSAMRTTPQGNNPSKAALRGSAVQQPTPDSSLWSVPYRANDPVQWPLMVDDGKGGLVGTKSGPNSGMTPEKVAWNNQVVENAYTRAKYQ